MLTFVTRVLSRLTEQNPLSPRLRETQFRHDGPRTASETALFLRTLADDIEGKISEDAAQGYVAPRLIECDVQADEDHKTNKIKYDFKIKLNWTARRLAVKATPHLIAPRPTLELL